MGRALKMKRGGGGKEGRERLHPTIVNLKYSVRQPTEPLIGSKLIETQLLLTPAWLSTISRWRVTKKIYRELSISWPEGF